MIIPELDAWSLSLNHAKSSGRYSKFYERLSAAQQDSKILTVRELFNAAQKLNQADQLRLASQLMQAIVQNMQLAANDNIHQADDPLIGLFAGTPDLATQSEDILTQEVNSSSGFSWKA